MHCGLTGVSSASIAKLDARTTGLGEITALLLSWRLHLEASNLPPDDQAWAAQHVLRGHRPVPILVTAVAAALVLAACSVARSATPTAVPAAQGQYVGLGDSHTAGSGIPGQVSLPAACERSSRSFPAPSRSGCG